MFPSWWIDDSNLIVIDIGIDESKSSPNPLLVVSAVVGNTSLMRKLNKEWTRDLENAGVDYFHATEHWNGSAKPYHGISRDERDKLLNRLISHIHHRFLFGASVFVDEAEYISAASARFRSQYGSPYGFAFQMLMIMILRKLHLQGRHNQPVNILIEDGHKNAQQAIGFIQDKLKRGPKGLKIGSYGLGGKKDNPILQAADMLAFGLCEDRAKGYSEFAARLASIKMKGRFFELPWDRSSVEAVKTTLVLNRI